MENKRLIKKYLNRKLYDVKSSSYVTLDELRFFVQAGQEVQVISNVDKADITGEVLLEAIVLEERRGVNNDKVELMHGIIQTYGTFTGALKK
jgi:polyhydroxyalkanoate synthesis repressor PhaR